MRAEEPIQDPVFQLNLLVWACLDQPVESEAYRVRPFFHNAGFRIVYIEHPFAFPVSIQQRVREVRDIGVAPSPDMLLTHQEKAVGLYIEAKKSSFGIDSEKPCRQARAHLIAAGPAFTEVYPTVKSCRLVYALPEARRAAMEATLAALSTDVAARGFEPGPASVHGFSVHAGEVRYHLDEPSRALLQSRDASVSLLPVPDDGETDPSPLLLVYTDNDSPDPGHSGYYRAILVKKVHAQLLCQLHQLQFRDPGVTQVISAKDLLLKTTGGVYEFLGKDTWNNMRVIVRDNLFKRLVSFWTERKPGVFALRGFELIVAFGSAPDQEEILEWLEDTARVGFKDAPADPHEVQQAEINFG